MMVLPGQPLRALHTAQVPAAALALSPASVRWEGCEPDLVSSCHLISCVTSGFGHLTFLSLCFLILAEVDNPS